MDPISDFFIRIKNAQRAGHEIARISYSRYKHEIAKALERAGLVDVVERKGKRIRRVLEIGILAQNGRPMMQNVKMLSTPSRRIYASYRDQILRHAGGVVLVSTSRGVMSGSEARRENLGGELIARIW